ncbi:hypothetical protein [Deinococcus pimensis]|nr:hypothetical protein [Deinococcus pimensis]
MWIVLGTAAFIGLVSLAVFLLAGSGGPSGQAGTIDLTSPPDLLPFDD